MVDSWKQSEDEHAVNGPPRQPRRDFLVRAGLMAGAVLCLSRGAARADDAPTDDTKITKLGLNEDEIKILTPRARDLTKKDLDNLAKIGKTNPKDKDEVVKEFNNHLKKDGKTGIVVKDLDSLQKATDRMNPDKKDYPKAAIGACCCCCPCCCCVVKK